MNAPQLSAPKVGDMPGAASRSPSAPRIDSAVLMRGEREIQIRHGEAIYRLRVTMSDKLILTK
jgi:hemin uptake protein HemP